MTEQSETYQKTLKAARERDPQVDLCWTPLPRIRIGSGARGEADAQRPQIQNVNVAAAGGGSDHENPKEVYQQADMAGMYRVVSQAVGRLRG